MNTDFERIREIFLAIVNQRDRPKAAGFASIFGDCDLLDL